MTGSLEWSVTLPVNTPLGSAIFLDEQRYELIGVEPYTRNDGQTTKLLVFRSSCPECDTQFEIKSGVKCRGFARRCPEHRKRLQRVSGKRGDRIQVRLEIAA